MITIVLMLLVIGAILGVAWWICSDFCKKLTADSGLRHLLSKGCAISKDKIMICCNRHGIYLIYKFDHKGEFGEDEEEFDKAQDAIERFRALTGGKI